MHVGKEKLHFLPYVSLYSFFIYFYAFFGWACKFFEGIKIGKVKLTKGFDYSPCCGRHNWLYYIFCFSNNLKEIRSIVRSTNLREVWNSKRLAHLLWHITLVPFFFKQAERLQNFNIKSFSSYLDNNRLFSAFLLSNLLNSMRSKKEIKFWFSADSDQTAIIWNGFLCGVS